MGRRPSAATLAQRARERQRAREDRALAREVLLAAADAWDRLTPQERDQFVRTHYPAVKETSLPSTWLRVRGRSVMGLTD